MARTYNQLGVLAYFREDYTAARRFYEQSLNEHRTLDERGFRDVAGLNGILANLGELALQMYDYAQAQVYLREALELGTARYGSDSEATAFERVNLAMACAAQKFRDDGLGAETVAARVEQWLDTYASGDGDPDQIAALQAELQPFFEK
ncbi:tetratricopeptide repeat protein [bacterium]|nr:tetratricopeptide repeat protein [bacterium]